MLNPKPKPGFPDSGPPISQFPGSGENREMSKPQVLHSGVTSILSVTVVHAKNLSSNTLNYYLFFAHRPILALPIYNFSKPNIYIAWKPLKRFSVRAFIFYPSVTPTGLSFFKLAYIILKILGYLYLNSFLLNSRGCNEYFISET